MYGFEFTQKLENLNSEKGIFGFIREDLGMDSCYSIHTSMKSYTNGDEHSGYTENNYFVSPSTTSSDQERKDLAAALTTVIIHQSNGNKRGLNISFNVPEPTAENDDLCSTDRNLLELSSDTQDETLLSLMLGNFVEEAYKYEVKLDRYLKADQPA